MNISLAAKSNGVAAKNKSATLQSSYPLSIRVSPNSYFAALFLTTFFSGFLIYLEKDWAGSTLFFISWMCFPILALTDRITFDGKKLTRSGMLPRVWGRINNFRYRVKISAIEQVETRPLRRQKRGGRAFYCYQTTVQGRGVSITFASGGEEYRQMAQAIFLSLPENMLDNCSLELLDYLAAPKQTLLKADLAKIPSGRVLEKLLTKLHNSNKDSGLKNEIEQIGETEVKEAEYLGRLANELRLLGYFWQSLEAFRRALCLTPKNARLLHDLARCLHSFEATSSPNRNFTRKAFAILRLAEMRGQNDSQILARIAESYFEYGDWQRAQMLFHRSIETADDNFRAIRGLAEIALRQGKIAHVIHHFSNAQRIAQTPALKRWTKNEGEYFFKLNADEDYMELEISRINMVENLERTQKTCLMIIFCGFPLTIFGVMFNENLIANLGWAISLIAVFIWVIMILSRHLLAARMPSDFEVED